MTILVTGGRGLLGRTLATYDNIRALGADALDIRDSAQIDRVLSDFSWGAVINCAAYTAVDRAETEIEAAYAINCDGADKLARGCRDHGIPMIHVSTDYVFDGTATQPYREDSPIAPINVYGSSKAAGERAVHDAGGIVVRTSWLFGERGPSFVHTIVRTGARAAGAARRGGSARPPNLRRGPRCRTDPDGCTHPSTTRADLSLLQHRGSYLVRLC